LVIGDDTATRICTLSQRRTVLLAKQAVEVDLLSGDAEGAIIKGL
jgi:hypothetical protein